VFLTRKHLSRRTVIKGAGVAIALPLLDAMIPAATALASTPAAVKPRLGFVYFPHGAVQKFWTPEGTGKDFKFSPILKPLEPFREYVTVVTGLRNKVIVVANRILSRRRITRIVRGIQERRREVARAARADA